MQSVYKVSDPTYRELSACWVEPFYTVSEPTSRVLSEGSAACLTCSKPTSKGLSADRGVHSYLMVSKTSFRGLSAGGGRDCL